MFLTSNTQTRRQERINYPADSGNKAQVCLSKNLLRTWVQSQHSGVRHERTAQCSTVSEKQEPENIAYSVGTALGLIPSTNIYKYLCVCIHLYLYILTLTTPYQHCPHLSMPGHTYRSHLGLVLTLYPVEAESHQLPLIRTSYTRVAGLQAFKQSYLSLPLHHTDAMTTDAGHNMQLFRWTELKVVSFAWLASLLPNAQPLPWPSAIGPWTFSDCEPETGELGK